MWDLIKLEHKDSNMKRSILTSFLVIVLSSGLSLKEANGVGLSDLKDVLNGFVKKGEKHVCKAGPLFSFPPRITLRSFKGEGCKNFREIFYFSKMVCQEKVIGSDLYKEYKKSQCFSKGTAKWGEMTPTQAKDKLIEESIKKGTEVSKLIANTACVAITGGSIAVQPELSPLIIGACSAAKKVGLF